MIWNIFIVENTQKSIKVLNSILTNIDEGERVTIIDSSSDEKNKIKFDDILKNLKNLNMGPLKNMSNNLLDSLGYSFLFIIKNTVKYDKLNITIISTDIINDSSKRHTEYSVHDIFDAILIDKYRYAKILNIFAYFNENNAYNITYGNDNNHRFKSSLNTLHSYPGLY